MLQKNNPMAIVIGRYCIKKGQKHCTQYLLTLFKFKICLSNPYKYIKNLNSLKLTSQ